VLSQAEVKQKIAEARREVVSMLPKATKVLDYRLDKRSETAAIAVLRGTGVFAPEQQINVGVFAGNAPAKLLTQMGLDDSQGNGTESTDDSPGNEESIT
jgi:hypothetical protein